MKPFDISSFALPNCEPGEFRFEEPRDIREIALRFTEQLPRKINVDYLRDKWPGIRAETYSDMENPARFGWIHMDDWFNGTWRRAQIRRNAKDGMVRLRFAGLQAEGLSDGPVGYDVDFRRTMGLRIMAPNLDQITGVDIYTRSIPTRSVFRIELDAGANTLGGRLSLTGYNAKVEGFAHLMGIALDGHELRFQRAQERSFEVVVDHMVPSHRYCGDAGQLTFHLDHDSFTISLEDLRHHGPIWYAEAGIFMARAEDPVQFADYRRRHSQARTINQQVLARSEQSYAGAVNGQPWPHPVSYSFGCKHSPQRYSVEPNGHLLLPKILPFEGCEYILKRFRNENSGRFLFGLENWICTGRYTSAVPAPVYNLHFKQGNLNLHQQAFCVPLMRSILDGELRFDEVTVALLRFRFENTGKEPLEALLELNYSDCSKKSNHTLEDTNPEQDEYLVPRTPLNTLTVENGRVETDYQDQRVLRCLYETMMTVEKNRDGAALHQQLQSGEQCEVVLKVPYLTPESGSELEALKGLEFERCRDQVVRFWRAEYERGSQLRCPVPQLEELYAAHLMHVQISDFTMPAEPELINTSVGTSTYGNFSNESCMIVQELDQRGFHEDCRRRLDLWVKYQGSVPMPGNFTDYDGMYFGAGGFEAGDYNQHHGWVLWCMAEHFFISGDRNWFSSVADSVVAGADWVFRQRRETMRSLPHSRGWEFGFLPAGSLEDVKEFYYWLSTNCLTWRGTDHAARALESCGHSEAARIREESDAFGRDLVKGFEIMRRHSPLVRLRDGRWVPHYPSRIYCRGRDLGWIRELLEGAIYLLISGLYDVDSAQASWILDDYQDNRYLRPPFGYVLRDEEVNYYHRGGFSIQPCLLDGLLPHMQRDEPELYIRMFFNAVASVFREEISGMVEHPMPELGFSNAVVFKTSDEANAVRWLRYLYVWWNHELLHFGRALPRNWLARETEISVTDVATYFGRVSVRYSPSPDNDLIVARVEMKDRRGDPRILVRFRHPKVRSIKSVRVNGAPWTEYDPEKGDVDITGKRGSVEVEARYK